MAYYRCGLCVDFFGCNLRGGAKNRTKSMIDKDCWAFDWKDGARPSKKEIVKAKKAYDLEEEYVEPADLCDLIELPYAMKMETNNQTPTGQE